MMRRRSLAQFAVAAVVCWLAALDAQALDFTDLFRSSYPVKATLKVTVGGEPLVVERTFMCVPHIRSDAGCPGCSMWRATLDRFVEPLKQGGALFVHFRSYCDSENRTSVLFTEDKPNLGDARLLYWGADIRFPSVVEVYPVEKDAAAAFHVPGTLIDPKSVRVTFEPAKGKDAAPSRLENEYAAKWFAPVSGTGPVWRMYEPGATSYPEAVWSKVSSLSDMVKALSKTAVIAEAEPDGSSSIEIAQALHALHEIAKSESGAALTGKVAFKPINGRWEIDKHYPIRFRYYYVGGGNGSKMEYGEKLDFEGGKKWENDFFSKQHALIDGLYVKMDRWKIVFDFSSRNIIEFPPAPFFDSSVSRFGWSGLGDNWR